MKKIIGLVMVTSTLGLVACKKSETTTPKNDKAATSEIKQDIPKATAPANSVGPKRILFVGNSHTEYFVSLPTLFSDIAKENGQDIKVDELVEMGISLQEIYDTDKTKAEKLFAKTDPDGNYYDYVVLQEKTPVAVDEAQTYKKSVGQYIEKIRKNSPNSAVYLYEVMSPADYMSKKDYESYWSASRKNALAIANANSNVGVFRLGDAVKAAYEGKQSYQYKVNGKDNLRYGQNTLHMLNDAGFMASTLLYATLFGNEPKLPKELTFRTDPDGDTRLKKQAITTVVSNPDALFKIAMENK